MMGASGQKRTHRVNTGMTELEREETERLEREMAATRARWAAKGPSADSTESQGRTAGGLSLASLLTGKATSRSATAPARMEPSHNDKETPVVQERTQSPSHDTPEGAKVEPATPLFAASPEPTASALDAGSARESAQPSSASPAPPPLATVTRSTEQQQRQQPQQSSSSGGESSPRKPTETLTRLQSSHIVSDRLRWSEQVQQATEGHKSLPPSAPPSPEKRRSVLERWGRDEPNAQGTVPSSPTAVRTRPKSIFDPPGGETESDSQQHVRSRRSLLGSSIAT